MSEKDWEKRARELAENVHESSAACDEHGLEILQFGREMADARAEEIARHAEGHINGALGWSNEARQCVVAVSRNVAWYARSTISKPKTREAVLEEALREIVDHIDRGSPTSLASSWTLAHRALNWRPECKNQDSSPSGGEQR